MVEEYSGGSTKRRMSKTKIKKLVSELRKGYQKVDLIQKKSTEVKKQEMEEADQELSQNLETLSD